MKRCLIVDDSRIVRKVVRQILEGFDFTCAEAENGGQAMAMCLEAMPDAILLDWNMPGMAGIEFLRLLRRTAGGNRPVVIFCTTENDLSRIREALLAGANEFIMKPFDRDIVHSKLVQTGLL